MKNKFILLFLLIFLSVFICLSGCNKSDNTATENKIENIPEPMDDSICINTPLSKDVTITCWVFPFMFKNEGRLAKGAYEQAIIDKFQEKYPNIKVKLEILDAVSASERLDVAVNSSTACDLLFYSPDNVMKYAENKKLARLDDIFDEFLLRDVKNDSIINACKFEGIPYMYPLSTAPYYMAFNKDMLSKSGVAELVKENWTKENFYDVLFALKKSGFTPGSLYCKNTSKDQGTRALVSNFFSKTIVDASLNKYNLSSSEAINALEFLKECLDKKIIENGITNTGLDDINNFVNGKTSFTLIFSKYLENSYKDILKSNNISIVEVPYPNDSENPLLEYAINGFFVFDNNDNDKIIASKKLIRYICDDADISADGIKRLSCFPVRKSLGDIYNDEKSEKIDSWCRFYTPYYMSNSNSPKVRNLWKELLRDLTIGKTTPKEAGIDFTSKANSLNKVDNTGK